jgi:glutaredoxin
MRIPLILLTLLAIAGGAGAQVFKWTDSSGKTHYGDKPPDDAKKQELTIREPSYGGPVEVTDWAAVLRKKSPEAARPRSTGVTMYSTDWCPHCRRARDYFNAKGIAFTEIDIEKSEAGKREYKALGGKGVPLITVGDKSMSGFSPQGFEKLRR